MKMKNGISISGKMRLVLGACMILLPSFVQTVHANAQQVSEISNYASDSLSPTFDEPDLLIEAFKNALASNEVATLAALLGLDAEPLMSDEATLETFVRIRDGVAKKLVIEDQGRTLILEIGEELWPFPFPVIRDDDGKWSFDTITGLQEIVNRRVGENELEAIETARAYLEAQNEYAAMDRDGDGVLEYAQKLISSEGETDGLYWPASPDAGESPAGEFTQEAAMATARQGGGYFGYNFRILKGQGDNIAGGAYDYTINGNMIAGFALIAWPVRYAETGVHTFVISHHGSLYEADLGEATDAIVEYINRFNPDEKWQLVVE